MKIKNTDGSISDSIQITNEDRQAAYSALSKEDQKQIDKAATHLNIAMTYSADRLTRDDLLEILSNLGIWLSQQKKETLSESTN